LTVLWGTMSFFSLNDRVFHHGYSKSAYKQRKMAGRLSVAALFVPCDDNEFISKVVNCIRNSFLNTHIGGGHLWNRLQNQTYTSNPVLLVMKCITKLAN
jgi:hypothetical protein